MFVFSFSVYTCFFLFISVDQRLNTFVLFEISIIHTVYNTVKCKAARPSGSVGDVSVGQHWVFYYRYVYTPAP